MLALEQGLERQDIQGIVVSGYGDLTCASYMLLRVEDAATARAWLGRMADTATTAQGKREPSINLALTHHGLGALGLDGDTLNTFPTAFLDGMASDRRARILGDRDESHPSRWRWGSPANPPIHVLLMVFAKEPSGLAAEVERQRAGLVDGGGLAEVLTLEAGRQPDSREHFGFADGIAQPVIEGTGRSSKRREDSGRVTQLKPGEFLLGYVNAYGQPADVPTVAPERDPKSILAEVPAAQARGLSANPVSRHDLGRNGSYLVFRQMAQDVAGFWQFLDAATRRPDGSSDPAARTRLGAKLVGRWPSGAPLVKAADTDPHQNTPTLSSDDDFAYAEADPHGVACPIGSHVRRANPRDSLVSQNTKAEQAQVSADRHRLLRRGRAYGERLADPLVDDGAERGLHFICLNSDIERQFEFVQQTWVNNPVLGGLNGEVDPLIGDQGKGRGLMTVQGNPVRTRIPGLGRFVTVTGGAYFFLPSIRALRFLASLGG